MACCGLFETKRAKAIVTLSTTVGMGMFFTSLFTFGKGLDSDTLNLFASALIGSVSAMATGAISNCAANNISKCLNPGRPAPIAQHKTTAETRLMAPGNSAV